MFVSHYFDIYIHIVTTVW